MTELLGSFTVRALRRHALLRGAASSLDLRGDSRHQYRFSTTPSQADFIAIQDDWVQVGQDMQAALDAAARERLGQ